MWRATATGAPQCANDNFMLVEGVIEMAIYLTQIQATKANDTCFGVRCANSRQKCEDSEGCFQFSRENLSMGPILKPPSLLAPNVSLRRCCKADATLLQRDLSSLRISSASTSRPAATSASDWRNASWSAARSASSSQSPGSSGSSSISVPSGRSVGSSTTSRPSRTRALIVIQGSVAPGGPPNKGVKLTALRCHGSVCARPPRPAAYARTVRRPAWPDSKRRGFVAKKCVDAWSR